MQVIEVGFSDGNGHYCILWYDENMVEFKDSNNRKIDLHEFNDNLMTGNATKYLATTDDNKTYVVSSKSQHAKRRY